MNLPRSLLICCVVSILLLATAGCEQLMGPQATTAPPPERHPDTAPPQDGDVIGRTPAEPAPPEPTLPPPQPPAEPGPQVGDRDYVPPTARVVTSGAGRHLNYHADRTGRIYVQEATTGRLIFSGRIQTGEQFDFNPHDNRAAIDGRTVLDRDLDAQSEYRVLFEADNSD